MKFLLEEPEFNIELLREKQKEIKKNNPSERGWNSSPRLQKEKNLKDFTKKLTVKREELLEDEKFEVFTDIIAENHCFLTISVEIKALKIHMISKNYSISIVNLPSFISEISLRNELMDFQAKILGFGLKEMTNYPVTGPKFAIEGGLDIIAENSDNLIEISYLSYENNSKYIVNNIASKLKVEIFGLEILWLQQPMMRILDFLKEEIITVLTNDYKTPGPIKEDARFLMFSLKKPRFSQMAINIINSRILLKAKPNDCESFFLGIKEIKIENFQEKNTERITKIPTNKRRLSKNLMKDSGDLACEFLWVEGYAIGIEGGRLGFLKEREVEKENRGFCKGNSKAFAGSLLIEKVIMAEEYVKIYQEELGNLRYFHFLIFFQSVFFIFSLKLLIKQCEYSAISNL